MLFTETALSNVRVVDIVPIEDELGILARNFNSRPGCPDSVPETRTVV